MSLIRLTEHLRAGRSMARSLLLLIALTGAVIVGLLAMRSFNAHATAEAGHATSMAAEMTDSSAGDSHATTAAAEACADCGTGNSSMLAMACVLALLATVLLLARPRGDHQWLTALPRPGLPAVAPLRAPRPRPPSLTALCISRT